MAYDDALSLPTDEDRRRKEEERAAQEREMGIQRPGGGMVYETFDQLGGYGGANPVLKTGANMTDVLSGGTVPGLANAKDGAAGSELGNAYEGSSLNDDFLKDPVSGESTYEPPDRADIPDFTWDPTAPPPPPTPPATPPPTTIAANMPTLGEMPEFTAPGDPADAPNYSGITDDLAGYSAPAAAPAAAPDYGEIAANVEGFQPGEGPGDAPAFEHGVDAYETPEGTFGGEDIYGNLETYAQDWLANPNRYLSELAESERLTSDAEFDEYERGARVDMDEFFSGRGLVASNYEGEARIDLKGEMSRARGARDTELLRMLATAETEDRERAGRLGIDTGEFGKELGSERRGEAKDAQALALERGELDLTADELKERAKEFRAELSLDEAKTMAEDEARRAGISLSAAELTERAEQFRSEHALESARTAAEQERADAGLKLTAKEMQEEAERFRSEFALEAEKVGFDAAFKAAELKQRDSYQRAALELDAAIAGDKAAMDRVRTELDKMRIMEQATMDRAELEQRDQELELRAYEIQTDAQLRGQEMDIDVARTKAEFDMRGRELEQRDKQAIMEEEGRGARHDDWIDAEFGDVGALDAGGQTQWSQEYIDTMVAQTGQTEEELRRDGTL